MSRCKPFAPGNKFGRGNLACWGFFVGAFCRKWMHFVATGPVGPSIDYVEESAVSLTMSPPGERPSVLATIQNSRTVSGFANFLRSNRYEFEISEMSPSHWHEITAEVGRYRLPGGRSPRCHLPAVMGGPELSRRARRTEYEIDRRVELWVRISSVVYCDAALRCEFY
jgi:hypothetical protein